MNYAAMIYDMVLVGPNEGLTVRYGDCTFVRGSCRAKVSSHAGPHFLAKMARMYNAHPAGSDALKAAQAAWEAAKKKAAADAMALEAAKEAGDGVLTSLAKGPSVGPTDDVRGEDRGLGGPAEAGAPAGGGAGADGAAAPGADRAGGDGLPNAGDAGQPEDEGRGREPSPGPVNMELAAAIKKLDPAVDAHWNDEGEPALAAVELAYGNAGVTRQMVRDAAPDWTRAAAAGAKKPAEVAADPLS